MMTRNLYDDISTLLEEAWEKFQADPEAQKELKQDKDNMVLDYMKTQELGYVIDIHAFCAGKVRLEAWECSDNNWIELSSLVKTL
jgi:hypothetical protein